MSGVDKELLFKRRIQEAVVEVPGIGTFRVRGLTRDEVLAAQAAKGTAAMERRIVSLGVVDPPLSEAEVARWQMASPAGEMEPITDRIEELSGLSEGARRKASRDFRGDTGPGNGVLPGSEAGDDSRPAAPGNDE